MLKKLIKVPDFAKEDRLSPQLEFIVEEILFKIEAEKSKCTFEIDFRDASFCSCFLLGMMHTLIGQLKNRGHSITTNGFGKVHDYLSTIHFDDFFLIGGTQNLQELDKYKSKSYLPILHFPRAENLSGACIDALLQLIYKKTSADANLKNDISSIICEITDNVIEHSEANTGMIYAQYYSTNNVLDIMISDSGQGVFQSYSRNNNFKPSSNREALQFALEGKSSKYDGTDTRGFGIEDSRERILKRNNGVGRFMMWSGSTIYTEMVGGKKNLFDLQEGWINGCTVFIRLSC